MPSSAKKFFVAVFLLSVPAHAVAGKAQDSSPFAPELCAVSN